MNLTGNLTTWKIGNTEKGNNINQNTAKSTEKFEHMGH